MSSTSYVPVRFVGGPLGGTTRDFAGEPKRSWAPKRASADQEAGSYSFEFDRDDSGVKQRSGVYTWKPGEAFAQDGDSASALMEELGPEKAAEALHRSGSVLVTDSADQPQDGAGQATGDAASAELAKDESKDDTPSKAPAKSSSKPSTSGK